jgi:hypothetical protein
MIVRYALHWDYIGVGVIGVIGIERRVIALLWWMHLGRRLWAFLRDFEFE